MYNQWLTYVEGIIIVGALPGTPGKPARGAFRGTCLGIPKRMPPALTSEKKVERFLTDLATINHVAASTQNQAFNALLTRQIHRDHHALFARRKPQRSQSAGPDRKRQS